jgi:hypothetical protein
VGGAALGLIAGLLARAAPDTELAGAEGIATGAADAVDAGATEVVAVLATTLSCSRPVTD